MSEFSAERSDSKFDAALEECCRRLLRGEDIERFLADYAAEYRGELARLAPLGPGLVGLALDPSPAFQARLHDVLFGENRRKRASVWPGALRRLAASRALQVASILMIVACVLTATGMAAVAAADESLPDSPLYLVKETQESAALWAARDTETRVGIYARQVGKRGVELRLAVLTQKPRPVVTLLADRLGASMDEVVDQALEMQTRGHPRTAFRARNLMTETERRLNTLIRQSPADLQPPLQDLLQLVQAQHRRLQSSPVLPRRGS